MRVISATSQAGLDRDAVLTIGSFDGVHCGHQTLLRGMVRNATEQSMVPAVLTFNPHPREVLQPGSRMRYLTTDAERGRLLEALGVELLILLPFDRALASTTAGEFLQRLHTEVRMRELWVGPDFHLGRNRQGDIHELGRLTSEVGYRLHVVARVGSEDEPVSSTHIRSLLEHGHVSQVVPLLGRHYGMGGVVRYGAQRGRRLGFRTANIRVGPLCGCPANGVYAVWGEVDGIWHPGVANLGRRPSFDAGERLLEVHLLDFEGQLYGRYLRVLFVDWLRGERRYEDPDELVAQVQQDMARARAVLTANPPRDRTLCQTPDSAS